MREVPRVVWSLAAGVFTNAVVSFTFVYLFVWLTAVRDLPVAQAGLIAGTGGVGLVAGNFTGGWFGDHLGHRRVLLAGSAVSGAGLVLLPALPTAVLLPVLLLAQYAAGTVRAANSALVAVSVPEGARRQGFAVLRFASNAGFTVGPPLGALLAAHTSYTWLFVADGVGTLLFAGYAARALPAEGARRARAARPADAPGLWTALRARPAVMLLLATVLVTDTVYRQQYSTLPVWLADHGIGTGAYGWLIAVNGGVILCLEIPATVALRRRPPLPITGTGLVLVGAGYAALTGGPYIATAVTMMVFLTAGEILYKTTATAYVADSAPDHLQGRFQSLYAGASVSGTVLAPPLGGALYEAAPGALWPVCAVLAALSGAVLLAAAAWWRRGAGEGDGEAVSAAGVPGGAGATRRRSGWRAGWASAGRSD
ncbi:MFS transporter [Actinacidiphila glaucinigra]|uniref:Predicted arabinose efflux permease, MFS family n=1 Tax=Actinacidiphila glaucinigra TaxID=235986 RepID=A0A238ZZH5_9ACTN|nr:MFS transporter [Actinacidiphila glaucinigra]SNR88720.1 Predicted arabinose efflux permease, MFS family [Actinacidiphila glaucinigra]